MSVRIANPFHAPTIWSWLLPGLLAPAIAAGTGVEVSAIRTDGHGGRSVQVTPGGCRLRTWRPRAAVVRIYVPVPLMLWLRFER